METPFDYLDTSINGETLSSAYKMGFQAGQEAMRKAEPAEKLDPKPRFDKVYYENHPDRKAPEIDEDMVEAVRHILDDLVYWTYTKMPQVDKNLECACSILKLCQPELKGDKTMNGKLEAKYHLICDKCSKLFWHEDGFLSPQVCDECREDQIKEIK